MPRRKRAYSSSTLVLELPGGVICGNKGSATFTIAAATGAFAGLAVLPGTVRVTLIPGVPADTAQYRATIVPEPERVGPLAPARCPQVTADLG